MPHVRLIGLFLFITTIFIALAAAVTQTTHIRFKRPDRVVAAEQAQQVQDQPTPDGRVLPPTASQASIQFREVPILYPLAIVGFAGLLLWFLPATTHIQSKPQRHRPSKRNK